MRLLLRVGRYIAEPAIYPGDAASGKFPGLFFFAVHGRESQYLPNRGAFPVSLVQFSEQFKCTFWFSLVCIDLSSTTSVLHESMMKGQHYALAKIASFIEFETEHNVSDS